MTTTELESWIDINYKNLTDEFCQEYMNDEFLDWCKDKFAKSENKVNKGCGKKVEDGFYCGEYKYLCSECVKKGKNEK